VTFHQYDFPDTTREGDIHVMGDMRAVWFKETSPRGRQRCKPNGANYRLDTPSARAFLSRFVTLP
jgi:hypothetical protein